jgi:signal transduction histidine kinase
MTGVIGVATDVTAQRRAEEQLRRSLDELRRTQAELVERERLAALGRVATVLAHEIRNPLTAIANSLVSLPKLVPLQGDAATLFDIIRTETDHLGRIARSLLDFARPMQPVLEAAPLVPLIEDAVDHCLRAA